MGFDIDSLKFDEKGLIPAIIQGYDTKQVLMVGYMNRESIKISLEEKRTCFFSRSRQELWRKGETSGNVQNIVSIKADCDKDALVVEVNPAGPSCHTGEYSCFFNDLYFDESYSDFSLNSLYEMLRGRKENPQENSYTSYLFSEGEDKILKKIGEECTEVIIGVKNNDDKETVYEISDLVYHVIVMMVNRGIPLSEIYRELASRHIIDKKEKQNKMGDKKKL